MKLLVDVIGLVILAFSVWVVDIPRQKRKERSISKSELIKSYSEKRWATWVIPLNTTLSILLFAFLFLMFINSDFFEASYKEYYFSSGIIGGIFFSVIAVSNGLISASTKVCFRNTWGLSYTFYVGDVAREIGNKQVLYGSISLFLSLISLIMGIILEVK